MTQKRRSTKAKWRPKIMRHLPAKKYKNMILLPTRAKLQDTKKHRRIYFVEGTADKYMIRYRPGKGTGFRKVRLAEMREARELHFAKLKNKQKHHQHAMRAQKRHRKK